MRPKTSKDSMDSAIVINTDSEEKNNECMSFSINVPDKDFMEKVGQKLESESRRGSVNHSGAFDFTETISKFRSMSNADIAIWIDVKSRFIFPLLYVIFIVIYFFYAYRLNCKWFKNCPQEEDYGF